MANKSARKSLGEFLRTTSSVGVLIAAAAMTSGIAYAQTADEPIATTPSASTSTQTPEYVDEVVVTGRRIAQDTAIAAKRNAKQVVDTLTAADAGRLPDNNVAESLSRISGITTLRNGDTGDGDFISIRGLDSALNNVQFNGVNSGQASGGDRRVPMDGISAEDISEIRVAKSLLPQDEGEGIGGAINIISKTPLERGEDQLRFNVAGRYNEFSEKTGYEIGGGFTKIFNDKFGVSGSINKRRRYLETIEVNANSTNPARLPQIRDANGNVISVDDIINNRGGAFDQPGDSYDNVEAGLFSDDDVTFEDYIYELSNQTRDSLSLSGAVDWQVSDTTRLTLGGFLSKQDTEATEGVFTFEVDEEEFINVNGVATTVFDDAEVDLRGRTEDKEDINGNVYLKGVTELDRLTLKYQGSYARASESAPFFDLRFDTGSFLPNDTSVTTYIPWVYQDTYFASPNLAVLDDPRFIQAFTDLNGTQIGDAFEYTPEDKQANDRYALRFDADYELGSDFMGGKIASVQVGGKFERSNVTRSVLTLADDIEDVNIDGTYSASGDGTAEDTPLGQFTGLFGGFDEQALRNVNSPFAAIGIDGFPVLNETALRSFFNTFGQSYAASGSTSVAERTFLDVREDVFSAYAQAEFEWEKLNVILGARIEDYSGTFTSPSVVEADVSLDNFDGGNVDLLASSALDSIDIESGNTEILPRMAFNYDLSDTIKLRGGAGYSIARPTYRQLARTSTFEVLLTPEDTANLTEFSTVADIAAAGLTFADLDSGETEMTVETGNPALKNAKSLNLDFSAEYYPSSSTALTAGLFYKEIDNFIFVGAESDISGSFDASITEGLLASLSPEGRQIIDGLGGIEGLLASGIDISLEQPSNGGTAEIYGLELGLVHAFDWAPGIFNDMGFAGNITFTESEATYDVARLEAGQDYLVDAGFYQDGDVLQRTTSFFAAPDVSGNASIYYEANGLEIAFSASYQSSAFDASDDYGLDQFNDAYFQADFFAGYKLPIDSGDYSIFLEVADFTDNGTKATDAQSVGRNGNLFDEASFNGREVVFGLRGKF